MARRLNDCQIPTPRNLARLVREPRAYDKQWPPSLSVFKLLDIVPSNACPPFQSATWQSCCRRGTRKKKNGNKKAQTVLVNALG